MFAGADKLLFVRAAELRKRQTNAEEILWGYLRTKPGGFKFRRQHPFLNYILDFYCHTLHLVIEVDGRIHEREDVKQNDQVRQKHLQDHSLQILRFTNEEIEQRLEHVICEIENCFVRKEKLYNEGTKGPKSPL
ncbi:MAG: DUF559 domain-containing protein [Chitinophagaceae bacterium]|nr:MAG: DUF559 domain-containing protein [Chitinophagaceae bacterium]